MVNLEQGKMIEWKGTEKRFYGCYVDVSLEVNCLSFRFNKKSVFAISSITNETLIRFLYKLEGSNLYLRVFPWYSDKGIRANVIRNYGNTIKGYNIFGPIHKNYGSMWQQELDVIEGMTARTSAWDTGNISALFGKWELCIADDDVIKCIKG